MGRKVTNDLSIPLATDNLLGLSISLATNATINIIEKLGRKVSKKTQQYQKEYSIYLFQMI